MKQLVLVVLFLLIVGTVAAQGPSHTGELAVAGLNDTVEILRDSWGVPHIYASNIDDLFFAQGYTQAMDRWWQMELYRKLGSGSLYTRVGEMAIEQDVYFRTLGLRRVAERELVESYDRATIRVLEAFASGVNAYISGRTPAELAYQYQPLSLMGIQPDIQPWTPVDTLVWGKVMALQLGSNEGYERLLSRLYGVTDADLMADWLPEFPYGIKPTIVREADLPALAESVATAAPEAGIVGLDVAQTPLNIGIGSNNWVVDGSMTESGLPLLANDMHLSLDMPSIWYEIGLHCQPVSDECPYNVTGFAFAPSPAVIAGHNDQIAWGHTNVGPDTQDLYQLRINPENELQYEWNGAWRDMTIREERLGEQTLRVRETHLGPIMTDDLNGFNNDEALALRWTALEPGTLFEAVLLLNQAQNWSEFRAALAFWDSPSQNIVYADVDGNIGYQVPGRIPARNPGHTGLLPVPGWTDEYEWLGYIEYDLLPRIWNPERGYVATANQAVVPPAYYDWLAEQSAFGPDVEYRFDRLNAYGYRADRISTLLEDLTPHTPETFARIHGDNYDGSAAEILPFVLDLDLDDTELMSVRDWMGQWDYQMHMDSPQAALWAFFWRRLVDNLYNDQFAGVHRVSGNNNDWWATALLLEQPDDVWWDDVRTGAVVETRDDILRRSLGEAWTAAVEELGPDRDLWRWGDLHTTTFVSLPLGVSGVGLIENVVNRGSVATSGTSNAVNATGWSASSGHFRVGGGPSERVIYDLSNWDNSVSMHTTGQSGHPGSPHYDDMIDPWRFIEYKPMLWSRESVQAAAAVRMVLNPAD